MVQPAARAREGLDRNAVNQRPASSAAALMNIPRPSAGPAMGHYPAGLAHQQNQAGGRHVVPLHTPALAPAPVLGRGIPAVTNPPVPVLGRGLPVVTNSPVPVVGRPLPTAVVVEPTTPVFVPTTPVVHVNRPVPQQAVVLANPPRRHIQVVTNSWTPVAAFALAVLGIGAVASVLVAPEAALIIFPAALLLAISSVVFKALLSK